MPYSQSWLEDNTARRCILVVASVYDVIATSEIVFYMSSTGYTTADSSVVFLPILDGKLTFSENISRDGSPSVSYGDMGISNPNGEYDSWLDSTKYIWTNRNIQIYYGDPSDVSLDLAAVYTNFQQIFNGIISGIDSKDRKQVSLRVRDKMERLNSPITENKIGTYGVWAGGQTNQDSIKPLIFGEVHNIAPTLINPATLEYLFNDGNSEELLEIRDNGVPVYTSLGLTSGATVSNTTGTFMLTVPLVGTITVSAQGVRSSIDLNVGSLLTDTYSNRIANLIALIVTQYGKPSTRLAIADLDLANFAAFNSDNPQPVGIMVSDRENVLSVCEALASSIGAQIVFTRTGLLRLIKYGIPTADPVVTITDSDILHHSLSIVSRTDIEASTKIGYAKNWTVQNDLTTAIPQEHKDLFGKEWLTVTSTNTTVQDLHKLNSDVEQKDTMLISTSDALAEANRLRDFYVQTKTIYGFKGTSKLLSLRLGQQVVLRHNRFDLSNGVNGQVVSLAPDWGKGNIAVEVLV